MLGVGVGGSQSIGEPGQLVRRAVCRLLGVLRLRHELVDLGDVLAHAHHPDDVALYIYIYIYVIHI